MHCEEVSRLRNCNALSWSAMTVADRGSPSIMETSPTIAARAQNRNNPPFTARRIHDHFEQASFKPIAAVPRISGIKKLLAGQKGTRRRGCEQTARQLRRQAGQRVHGWPA